MQPTSWSPPPPAPASQSGCLHALLFALACLWVATATIVVQSVAWFYDQFQLLQGVVTPGWLWVAVALGQALLLALPVLPLAMLVRAPRFRAAYRAWALAIGFGVLLSLARLCPITWTQPAAVVQIALSLLATSVLAKLKIDDQKLGNETSQFSMLAPALSIAMLIILPWLRDGALGSPLDTLLNLLAALSLGLFAGLLLDRFLVAPMAAESANAYLDVGFGGVAAGVALLLLGAGFGYGGQQIMLMICLLPLGGAAVAVGHYARKSRATRAWLPIAGLVGLVAAGPLLFLDPDEFFLGIGEAEVGMMLRTAFLSLMIAFVLGLALWVLSTRINRPPRRGLALASLAACLVVGLLVYMLGGQPGFYGERLFVILREQADVGVASQIASRDERLSFVYDRLTQQAEGSQANLRATLDRLGVEYRPYYLVNAIEVDGGPLLRAYLATLPEVDRILDSPRLRPLPDVQSDGEESPEAGSGTAPTGPQWNIRMIGADRVWDELGVNGQGIVIGESDSGVQGDHPALRDSYRGRDGQNDYNWLDPWNGSRAPIDGGGHGTHTTGTIVGAGGVGVAPGAQWIGCVNLARNLANPPYYLDCLQFMLAPYAQGGDPLKDGVPSRAPHVLNNSWGCPPLEGCDAEALEPAVRALRAAGIFVVASAGNEGPRCESVSDPIAIYDTAFSVGAVDQSGDLADFSSRGPVTADGSGRVKPDIVAPGVDVNSALPGSTYGENSGTSMAGPHVAGVVALIWSAQPKLIGDIARTEQILIETAQPYQGAPSGCDGAGLPSNGAGYGLVDAYAAVRAALGEP
ncbi:MAG TPA: S8 family serine peptidase [Roseiflexaceae bacterium]|nr:S8 family serine peptidase [Roseiflexaceae bacterium]